MHDDDEIAPEGVVLRKRRKGIYILPNLFTLAALFGGFYAVVMAMNGRFDLAAAGVFSAMVLDALDGRVARMTNTQSAFGEQMDSLSDMVSFGAAPGLIAYEWALKGLGRWGWIAAFPLEDRDPVWQRAFEAGYQEALLKQLARPTQAPPAEPIRPQSQSMYCIDVRTEVFRRHLEAIGDHETYAFGGFFGAAIRFRRWGREGHIDQVPAIMQPRNEVKEVPRTYHEHLVPTHRARARWLHAGHALLRDLKENVVTPYVMVESLGWFYGLPLVGKTLAPSVYKGIAGWFKKKLLPPIPTSLTVDKLSPAEVENMVASEQRDTVWKTLRARFGVDLDPRLVEAVRLYALGDGAEPTPEQLQAAEALGLTPAALEELVQTLRRDNQIEARSASRRNADWAVTTLA